MSCSLRVGTMTVSSGPGVVAPRLSFVGPAAGAGRSVIFGNRHADLGTEGVRDRNLLSFCIVFAIEIGSAARSELWVVQNRGLRSIEPRYAIASAMFNDKSSGTIRMDMHGHSSPRIETRLPPPLRLERICIRLDRAETTLEKAYRPRA